MGFSAHEKKRRLFDVRTSDGDLRKKRRSFSIGNLLYGRNALNLRPHFRTRHPWISALGVLVVIILIFAGIRQFSSRAEVSDFYPSTCLGNWQNPSNAANKPETMGGSGISFTSENSAMFSASGTQIFCGGFVSPNASSAGTITNVGLTLVWQVGDGASAAGEAVPVVVGSADSNAATSSFIAAPSSSDGVATTTVPGAAPAATSSASTTPSKISHAPASTTATFAGSSTPAPTSTSTSTSTPTPTSTMAISESSTTPATTTPAADATTTTTITATTTPVSAPASDTTPTPAPTPDATTTTPAPAPASAPAANSSSSAFTALKHWLSFLIAPAFADDVASGSAGSTNDSSTVVTLPPIMAALSPVAPTGTASSSASPAGGEASSTATTTPADAIAPPAPDENFLQVSYSTDGTNWIPVQKVSEANWNNLTITLPVRNWSDLSKLQIRVASIPTSLQVVPPVYLDGMLMEVHYEVLPIDLGAGGPNGTNAPPAQESGVPVVVTPVKIAPVNGKTNFGADEAPTFEYDLNNLPSSTPASAPTSAPPQSFNDRHANGNPWRDFFYSLLDRVGARADAQVVSAPPAPTQSNPVVAEIDDPAGKATGFQPVFAMVNNQLSVGLPEPSTSFRPGRYTLKLWILHNGTVYETENSFTWGVLAVNFDKSIYDLNDTAHIGLGVLDDAGNTICGTPITMTIIDPAGVAHQFGTANGTIQDSPKCGPGTVTNLPDYAASLIVRSVGTYQVSVTATTANGTRTVSDHFDVQDPPLFDVTRAAPTRIYPPVPYGVSITVKANANYNGTITESVPASFGIASGNFSAQSSDGTTETLTWQAKLKKGDEAILNYTFKAPDVSPELYKIGPLQIGTWAEARQWQIAADAIATKWFAITSTASTTWTVPADWNSASNTIEVIGGGGNGVGLSGGQGAGGGGGGYSKSINQTLTPGATVGIHVGAVAGDTYVCNATSNCASIAGTAVIVGAKGGASASGATAGAGGATSTAVALGTGAIKYAGGNGVASGGGGGAASPNGSGGNATGGSNGSGGASGSGIAGGGNGSACTAGTNGMEWIGGFVYGAGSGGGGKSGSSGSGCGGGTYGAAGGSGNKNTTAQGGQQGLIIVTYTPIGISLGDGTQPAPVTIGPGANATTSDVFTFTTNGGTSTITNVSLAFPSSTLTGLGFVEVANGSGTVIYGSSTNLVATSTLFASTTMTISVSGMNVSTATTSFAILVQPKSSAYMPTILGGNTFIVTSQVTGWSDSLNLAQGGANTTSSVITIDDQAPADVTNASGTAGSGNVALSWTNPTDADFARTIVIRATSSISRVAAMVQYTGTGAAPIGIAFDGTNIWTSNVSDNSVTKISPTGTMTTYTGTGAYPNDIAFDGTNMWTVNKNGDSVTKVSPTGTMTTYTGTGHLPTAIAFDGTNMWTANNSSSSVTKVSPTGTMTTYPGTGGNPNDIAFDGTNMWTVDSAGSPGSVTKVSPTGTMTTYTGTGGQSYYIGFDGTNMWTTDSAYSVTKVSPTGTMTTYSFPITYPPTPIVSDGVGNMWDGNSYLLSGVYHNHVAEISPTGTMAIYSSTAMGSIAFAGTSTIFWTDEGFFENAVVKYQIANVPPDFPIRGTSYTVGQAIGSSTVVCVVASSTSGCTDNTAANGQTYYYEIITADNYNNYSVGIVPAGNPFTPSGGTAGVSVSGASLNGGASIVLSPATTTAIAAAASVSDTAGPGDILYATSTIYRSGVGANCTANDLNCYQLPSSSCAFTGSTSTVTCTANIQYIAQPTDTSTYAGQTWQAAITVTGGSSVGTSTATGVTLNTLLALNVTTSSINYGLVAANGSSATQTTTIQNVGNAAISLGLSGTSLSLAGSPAITIPVSAEQYSTSSFSWGSATQLGISTTTVSGFSLLAPTTTASSVKGDLYWAIGGFIAPTGTYNGTVSFTASQ